MLTKFVHYPFLFYIMYIDVPTFTIDDGMNIRLGNQFYVQYCFFFKHESFKIVLFYELTSYFNAMDNDAFPSNHEFLYLADTADKLKYQ